MIDRNFESRQSMLCEYDAIGYSNPSHPADLVSDRDPEAPDLDGLEAKGLALPVMSDEDALEYWHDVGAAHHYVSTYWSDDRESQMRVDALAQTADEDFDRREAEWYKTHKRVDGKWVGIE